METNLLQEPRALFKGEYKPSAVTGKLEPHYPDWKRAIYKYCLSLPCLIACVIVTVGIMLFMFETQDFFENACEKGTLPVLFGLTNFIPKIFYANIISALNDIYKSICVWLNNKENYREELTHENNLIFKIVLVIYQIYFVLIQIILKIIISNL